MSIEFCQFVCDFFCCCLIWIIESKAKKIILQLNHTLLSHINTSICHKKMYTGHPPYIILISIQYIHFNLYIYWLITLVE